MMVFVVLCQPTFGQTTTDAWYNKGLALADLVKYDEAIKAFNESIRLDPSHAAAWYSKGKALYNQDKYDEAIQAYDEAIKLDPNYTPRPGITKVLFSRT